MRKNTVPVGEVIPREVSSLRCFYRDYRPAALPEAKRPWVDQTRLMCRSPEDPDCQGMMLTTSAKYDLIIEGIGGLCQAAGGSAESELGGF